MLFGKVKVTGTAGSSVIGAGKHHLPELLGSCIGQRDIGEANLSCIERPSVCGKVFMGFRAGLREIVNGWPFSGAAPLFSKIAPERPDS